MIIKVVTYKPAGTNAKSVRAKQRTARNAGAQLAHYIIAGERLNMAELGFEATAVNTHGDNPSVLAMNAASYVTEEVAGRPGRVVSLESSHLIGDDSQDWIDQMACHAEAAGLDRVFHIIYSHRPDEPVTPAMMRRHRHIIRRVMNLQHSPGLGAMHGDEDHDHFHDLVVAVDGPDGKPPKVGQGWRVEAAHIAVAICEFRSRLEPEPMRRYVADETGVYHFLTDTKVADPNGRILLDRKAMRTMQIEHDRIVRTTNEIGRLTHDMDWPEEQILEKLVRPRIRKARNWQEVHRNLARIGVRYVVTGNTASVEFNKPQDSEKAAFGLSSFYPRAALGKLEDRFKQTFEPAHDDIWVRPFIAPRYEQEKPDLDGKAERKVAREEAKELEAYRAAQAKSDRDALNAAHLRDTYNAASKKLAEADREEKAAIRAVKKRVVRRPKGSDQPLEAEPDTIPEGMFWGEPSFHRAPDRQKEAEEEEEFERRYRLRRRRFSVEYFLGDQVAFVAYRHTIAVHTNSKKAQLDALRLAESKFGVVKVFGSAAFKDEMIALAREHDIRIDAKQLQAYERKLQSRRRAEERHVALEPSRDPPQRGKMIAFAPMRPIDVDERDERNRRIKALNGMELQFMRTRNQIEDEDNRGPNPKPTSLCPAMRKLDAMNRDTMLLASSRYEREGVRYLDDEVLMTILGSRKHVALRPEMQQRLEAIALIQARKRETICAALATGAAEIRGGELVAASRTLDWASPFYAAQKSDPVFQRMTIDADRGHIDLSHVDVSVRPELAVWREARGSPEKPDLADAVATELFLTTAPEQRDALFKVMTNEEGRAFRLTEGQIMEAYRGDIYRGKGESDHQWKQRQRNATRIFDRRSPYR